MYCTLAADIVSILFAKHKQTRQSSGYNLITQNMFPFGGIWAIKTPTYR